MSGADKKIKRTKEVQIKKELQKTEDLVFHWAERELDLNQPVDQLLFQLSMNYVWFTNKWASLNLEHKGIIKLLATQNPYLLYHLNEILKKNVKNVMEQKKWVLTESEAKLMMTLALLDDECEIEIIMEQNETV
jgi:hypothetical protein